MNTLILPLLPPQKKEIKWHLCTVLGRQWMFRSCWLWCWGPVLALASVLWAQGFAGHYVPHGREINQPRAQTLPGTQFESKLDEVSSVEEWHEGLGWHVDWPRCGSLLSFHVGSEETLNAGFLRTYFIWKHIAYSIGYYMMKRKNVALAVHLCHVWAELAGTGDSTSLAPASSSVNQVDNCTYTKGVGRVWCGLVCQRLSLEPGVWNLKPSSVPKSSPLTSDAVILKPQSSPAWRAVASPVEGRAVLELAPLHATKWKGHQNWWSPRLGGPGPELVGGWNFWDWIQSGLMGLGLGLTEFEQCFYPHSLWGLKQDP